MIDQLGYESGLISLYDRSDELWLLHNELTLKILRYIKAYWSFTIYKSSLSYFHDTAFTNHIYITINNRLHLI